MNQSVQIIRQNIHTNVRRLRKRGHITQEQMAQHIGISRRTYANYENGSHSMPVDVLVCVADYFEVPLDTLVAAPEGEPQHAGR